MTETFYSALGVDDDADAETIRRAYRDRVKETHPDVSDDPDAEERFKRLTAAKETLTDGDERARYDRLGHESYVSRHLTSDLWSDGNAERGESATARPSPAGSTRRPRQHSSDGDGRAAWLGDDGGPTKAERTATSTYRKRQQRGGGRASTSATSDEDWQYASAAYRSDAAAVGTAEASTGRTTAAVLRDIGPWLVIHIVFILSAVATAWLTYVQVESTLHLSVPAVLLAIAVVGLVVFVSALHVVSQVYG